MVPWSLLTEWQELKGAKHRARGQMLSCFSVCTHTFFSAVLNIVPLHPLVSLLWYHLVNASIAPWPDGHNDASAAADHDALLHLSSFATDDTTPSIYLLFSPLSPLSPLLYQTCGWHPFPNQDYFDIVKNPMDLSTIKRKLDTGQYQEPWQYVEDIWLMFNNAWLYNRKTSRVYKYCSKLAEVFESEIDPVMQGLGYCCGRKVRRVNKSHLLFRVCSTCLITNFLFVIVWVFPPNSLLLWKTVMHHPAWCCLF